MNASKENGLKALEVLEDQEVFMSEKAVTVIRQFIEAAIRQLPIEKVYKKQQQVCDKMNEGADSKETELRPKYTGPNLA